MKIGIVLPIEDEGRGAVPYPVVREMAQGAEAGGLDSVWVYDHLLFRFGDDPTTGLYECWTVLSAIAEATRRVELGTIVLCTGFRNPALLAKMAGTLDAISDGRLILGVGAGWHDPEFEAFGFPTDHKVSRFEEALAVITGLIRDGRVDLDGAFVQARDAVLVPPARPDIPILVAAKKPRMFELTARHADAWNMAWFGLPDERLATGRRELAEACERVGRDPADPDDHRRARGPLPGSRAWSDGGTGPGAGRQPGGHRQGPGGARGAGRGPRHRGARPQHARPPWRGSSRPSPSTASAAALPA